MRLPAWVTRAGFAAAGLLLVAGVLAGCGSSSSSSSSPNLKAQLLTVRDLPTGWSVDTSGNVSDTGSSGNSGATGCNFNNQLKKQTKAKAQVSFKRGSATFLEEELGYMGSPSAATNAYTGFTRMLDSCPSLDASGLTLTISKAPLGQTFGDRSDAWRATGSANGQTIGVVIVFGQSGSMLFDVVYGGAGSPSNATVSHYATLASSKFTGHAGSGGSGSGPTGNA